jgi:hypothetical protein
VIAVGCAFAVGCALAVGCAFAVGCALAVGCAFAVGCALAIGCALAVGRVSIGDCGVPASAAGGSVAGISAATSEGVVVGGVEGLAWASRSAGARLGAMRSIVASSLPSRRSSAMPRCCSRIMRATMLARSGWSTYSTYAVR